MSHRHAIDSVAIRDSRLFGWGWFLDDDAAADAIHLGIDLADGSRRMLRCTQAGSRPDLRDAFPHLPHAAAGGFMLQARLPDRADIQRIALHVQLHDGGRIELPMPELERACAATDRAPGASPPDAGELRLRRAWDLVSNSEWRELWTRSTDFLRRWFTRVLPRVRTATRQRSAREAWVMFDHAMGGGTNRFRDERIAEWRAAGIGVTLVTPVLTTLEYESSAYGTDEQATSQRHPDLRSCLASLGRFDWIVVNNLASYDDPLQVLRWAMDQRAAGAKLRFYLHDFHAACPAWTLIDDEGKYCRLPAFERCARCLPSNHAPFLAMMPSLDLPDWRSAWGDFVMAADEIIAFSASSISILHQAYPALEPARIALRPHSTAYLGDAPPAFEPRRGSIATIAVVGAIGEHKGARIIGEMLRLIERETLPVRIAVIGTLEGVPPSPALRVTGPYQAGDLPGLLAREEASVAFLPSIVHETFSYVTSELMHYRVPLAVFDLGAPAERVRAYPLGRIISEVDARTALTELLAFHRELSASAPDNAPMDAP